MKTFFICVLFVMIIPVLASCRGTWHQPFPESEIVYQTGDEYKVGFVNSNGSGSVILVAGGQFRKPVWSADGSLIFGLALYMSNSTTGYPSYWSKDGVFKVCKNLEHMDWIAGTGNPGNAKEVMISSAYQISIANLGDCTSTRTLVDYSLYYLRSTDNKSKSIDDSTAKTAH